MNSRTTVPWYASIGTRLLATVTLLIAAVVGAVLWQWASSARKLIREEARQEGESVAQTLALALVPFVVDENWNQARIVTDLLVQRNADLVYVIITDRRVDRIPLAFPADQEDRFVPDVMPLAVTRAAMKEGEPRFAETFLLHDLDAGGREAVRGERIMEVAQDLRFTTERFGVVRVGISLRRADQTLAATIDRALVGVAVSLVAVLIAAYFMSRSITRPVIELAALMQRVGDGELDNEAEVHGNHEVAHLSQAFNEMLAGLRQKRVLEKFVPTGARKEIARDKSGKVELGGHRVRAAILFSDLRGFTAMSERLEPQEVVALLNEYLDKMTRAISGRGGDINEYIGDAVLAVFRCDEENGALAAVHAAWDMQEALRQLKKETKSSEVKKLNMGIGIHVGDIVEGNIGSRDRVKFGVVGDTVNLAARIQDRSRDGKHTCIFVSDDVVQELGDAFGTESLGDFAFKGKTKGVVVHEITKRIDASGFSIRPPPSFTPG
ncbi:MAG: HAMP domain-containing protein [Labilithrix sp.]|nr:HAMP domain-containing protein [Labilithrix sp.]MCW5816175.1 HAMP domain-containing protein [Labilithrix sp.]